MIETKLDAFSRLMAVHGSRRRVLGAAVAGLAALSFRSGLAQPAQESEASDLVRLFYERVDAYQYSAAYDLLGRKWHAQQSLDAFARGYRNTAFVQCETKGGRVELTTTIVAVDLISWHNDGKIVGYRGAYKVGTEGGDLRILAGNNKVIPAPVGTRPLCTVDQLEFAFGPWDAGAGNRNSSIAGTNSSDETCVLGGSPRVSLTNAAGDTVRSTSQAGSPPEVVVVGPGERADAPLRFANWCGETGEPGSITIELPGDPGTGSVSGRDNGISYPPCLGEDQPALLEIKGWAQV